MSWNDFEFLQRSHFSFKDRTSDADKSDEEDSEEPMSESSEDSEEEEDTDKERRQERWKPLTALKDKKNRRERTQKEFLAFQKTAELQGIEVAQLAGYFVQREYYSTNI